MYVINCVFYISSIIIDQIKNKVNKNGSKNSNVRAWEGLGQARLP